MSARPAIARLRFVMLALLFGSTLVNYVDRQALSLLEIPLTAEYGWNATTYSHIVLAFQVGYAIAMTASGLIVARYGARFAFTLFVTIWSLAGMAHAAARGAISFGACRFLLGLGEAGNWPGAAQVTREWFAPKDRAFATGFWNMGSATGALVAGPIVLLLKSQFGWQGAFVGAGALGFLWLVAWRALYRPPENHPRLSTSERAYLEEGARVDAGVAIQKVGALALLRRRETWALMLARFVSDPVWWFFLFWLPKFLNDRHHLSLAAVAGWTIIPYVTADLGSLLGGTTSSLLIRRGWPVVRARKAVMVAAALLMPCAVFAGKSDDPIHAVVLISLVTFGHQFWASSVLTLPADLFGGAGAPTCSGLAGSAATIGGILATLATGAIVDRHGFGPVFTWAGCMHPLAAILILLLIHRRPPPTTAAPAGTGAPDHSP